MNLEKVVFAFFTIFACTLNFGFFIGDLGDPNLHHASELFAAIVVNLIALAIKFGDRTQLGATHLATSIVACIQLVAASLVWTWTTRIVDQPMDDPYDVLRDVTHLLISVPPDDDGDPAFVAGIAARFEGDWKLKFHFAPPLLSRTDPKTGRPRKRAFGPWMMPALRVLAKLKFLRGTAFDPFGRTEERRAERALVASYENVVDEIMARLGPGNLGIAVELASVPEQIRGFGPVKQRHLHDARLRQAQLLAQLRGQPQPPSGASFSKRSPGATVSESAPAENEAPG